MNSHPFASHLAGEDNDNAYYSAAPPDFSHQYPHFTLAQRWRERNLVVDSKESEGDSETEELPERQTEINSCLTTEVLDDTLEFATTCSIFDNNQLENQNRPTGILSAVPPTSYQLPEQIFDRFRAAAQLPDFINKKPELQQRPTNEVPSALYANSDSRVSQFSTTANLDQQELPLDERETVETLLVSQPIRLSQRAAPRFAFNTAGRLARDDSWITMDDGPTQKTNLPRTQPHSQKNIYSDFDRTDILCVLIPTTPAAYQAVELVDETAEHHILRRPPGFLPSKATAPADQTDGGCHEPTNPKPMPLLGIALRMNSVILNPALGFTFGRNKEKSDLLISRDRHKGVSQRHFRIYVNSRGSLMCQDTSTNGTYVDSALLRLNGGDQRTLHHGSVVEVLIGVDGESIRFMIQVPDRSGVSQKYGSKLDQYIEFVEQMERRLREEKTRKDKGVPIDLSPAPIPQFSHVLCGDKLSTRANKVLVAGTEPFNHGMQWNGGDTYHVTALLGKGAFASVYKLTRRADGELFAAKEIRKTVFAQRGVLDRRVEQELNIMKQLQHPNIVQYIEHHETPEYLYILMELVPHGDLQSVLQTRHVLEEYHCQAIASQMCEALKYLHDRDITHRDIKPDNILIQSNTPYLFKLSDFGLSKVVKNNETFLTSFCGTYLYCAPEVYPGYHHYNRVSDKPEPRRRSTRDGRRSKPRAKLPYTTAVDTWSIAAVLYHLLCGHPPYTGTAENYGAVILENIMGNPVNYSRLRRVGVSQDAINFLSQMLVIEPSLRMSDSECLEHPWMVPEKKPNQSSEALELMTQVAARHEYPDSRDTERAEEVDDLLVSQHLVSQLSINKIAEGPDSEDLDEPPSEDLEEIEEMIEGADISKEMHEGEEEFDSLEEYVDPNPTQIQRAQRPVANNNHLFGQISPAALRSSGALGREARRALGMPSQVGGEVFSDESHYEGSSLISATDYPNVENQPAPVTQSGHLDSGEAAPSLLGAEAMVDQLHMDSTMADRSVSETDNQALAPNVEGASEQGSQSGLDKSQSAQSDDYLYKATPPRSRRRLDEPSDSMRESKRVKIQHETFGARDFNSQMKFAEVTASRAGYDEHAASTNAVSAGQKTADTSAAITTNETPNQQGPILTTQPQAPSTPSSLTTKADKTVSLTVTTTTKPTTTIGPTSTTQLSATTPTTAQFTPPPPPSSVTYGTLTPTASSLPFPAIILKQRVTTFGRHPACDYTWPNSLDTRVPKFALDIAFWRPRLERSLAKHPSLKWQNEKDLRTIIATRTSSAIFVNGVALTKSPDAEKGLRYGVLKTGDLVLVFDENGKEGGNGEKLEFRVDVRIGRSKSKRRDGQVFEVRNEEQQEEGGKVGNSHGSALERHGAERNQGAGIVPGSKSMT
ncbi:MAG: hypothetical protein Q9178_007577 [Gyalolechia marmorata]